jgi:3',5'-cyclic AMP phosphodiesterase CpdA
MLPWSRVTLFLEESDTMFITSQRRLCFLSAMLAAAAWAASSAMAAGVQLRVQPYITWVTPTSITIQWETDILSSSVVEYGPTDGYGQAASAAGEARMHKVVVSNLKPTTSYCYRVKSQAGAETVASLGYTFRTAPASNTPFRFAFMGDTHTRHEGPPFAPEAVRVADGIRKYHPDLVVHSGDLVKGVGSTSRGDTEEQYRVELFGTAGRLMACTPYMVAIGDHERRAIEGDKVYAMYFDGHDSPYWGKTYYTFTYGDGRFIMLDCVLTSDHAEGVEVPGLSVGSAQYNWLVKVLEDNTLPWVFLSYHYCTYHSHPRFLERFDQGMRKLLGPLCDRYGVDMVMTGHAHLYERTYPVRDGARNDADGTVYVTAGIGGGSLMSEPPGSALTAAKFSAWGYGIVDIAGDKLTLRVYDLDGSLRDSSTLTERRPAARQQASGKETR